jgi:hypothetical protein
MGTELFYAGIMGISAIVQPELAPFILLGGGIFFIFFAGNK